MASEVAVRLTWRRLRSVIAQALGLPYSTTLIAEW